MIIRSIQQMLMVLLPLLGMAQPMHYANWTFGNNCGINFTDTSNLTNFYTETENLEANASISDSLGNLLFYAGATGSRVNPVPALFDKANVMIPGSDSLKIQMTVTNGLIILPVNGRKFILLHLYDEYAQTRGIERSYFLYISTIEIDDQNVPRLITANQRIPSPLLSEKLGATKHANGRDWWVIARGYSSDTACLNTIHKFLLKEETVTLYQTQKAGFVFCDSSFTQNSGSGGEIAISQDGSIVAMTHTLGGRLDIFSFDRCNGNLVLTDSFQSNPSFFKPYGIEFSVTANMLYVTTAKASDGIFQRVLQFELDSFGHIAQYDTLLKTNGAFYLGQLQLGIDGVIYMSSMQLPDVNTPITRHLSQIKHPEIYGSGCDFELLGHSLGDSCYTRFGLPNFPSYSLTAIGAYRMTAGLNQTICIEDSSGKGVQIGSSPVTGISFQWLNTELDSATRNTAKITVNPTESTWYYIEISDSTATGSCTSYVDSVLVEVLDCTISSIKETASSNRIDIYPNPAKQFITIDTHQPGTGGVFSLFSLYGQQVLTQQIHSYGKVDIAHLSTGVYIYQLTTNGQSRFGKLVIE